MSSAMHPSVNEKQPPTPYHQDQLHLPTSLTHTQPMARDTTNAINSSSKLQHAGTNRRKPSGILFAGRIGGNQEFVLDRHDPENASELARVPDAAPYMSVGESLDARGFREWEIWKAAIAEGIGCMLLTFITIWIGISPNALPEPPSPQFGPYANAAFIGPVVGGITNWVFLSLFIFAFSPVSGGHLNPLITIGSFFARLTSMPRMVLYVAFQTGGACLAGLMVRAGYGSRSFKVGGCYIFTEIVPTADAFAVEFMSDLILFFLAFGVGLDPRQRQIFGPALAPIFVGATLGMISTGTAFTRYGYGGASLSPARCLGAFVGQGHVPGYHWIHWIGPIVAAIVHGTVYYVLPPWDYSNPSASNFVGPREHVA